MRQKDPKVTHFSQKEEFGTNPNLDELTNLKLTRSTKRRVTDSDYKNFKEFLSVYLKNNKNKYYMQPNANYFCLFFSNNLKNYYANSSNFD